MEDKFFQRKLQESLDNQRIPYDETAWQRLAGQLDLTDGQLQPKRRHLSAAWLLLFLPLVAWNIALQRQVSDLHKQLSNDKSNLTTQQKIVNTIYVHDTINRVFYRNIYSSSNTNSFANATPKNNKSDSFSIDYNKENKTKNKEDKEVLSLENKENIAQKENKESEESKESVAELTTNHNDVILNSKKEEESTTSETKQIIKKKKSIKLKISGLWISGSHNLPINGIKEMAMSGGLDLRLSNKINLQIGVQSNNCNDLMQHDEIMQLYPAPMPHLSDDKAISVNYKTKHLSFPLQIQYFTKKKYHFVQPFFIAGVLMQQHQNAFLTYNFETQAHEAYYITKKIAEKHWKPFVTLGMGVDFCLKSNWAISLSVNARQALKTQYLLENEKRLVFINMGLKYKF